MLDLLPDELLLAILAHLPPVEVDWLGGGLVVGTR